MAQKQKTEKELVASAAAAAVAPRRRSTAPRSKANKAANNSPALSQAEAPAQSPVTGTTSEPSYDEIALLAYSYWEARGCQGGCPEEDWLLAEQQLRSGSKSN